MRLVWLELRGYRRFESAKINLDAPVVALVGPNEAGKSSLLHAIVAAGSFDEFDERDFTRNLEPQVQILDALFALDSNDHAALRDRVPEAPKLRWYRVWKDRSGKLHHQTIPEVAWLGEAASRTRDSLTKLRALNWANSAPEHILQLVDEVILLIPESDMAKDYEDEELEQLEELKNLLIDIDDTKNPKTLFHACDNISTMIVEERQRRPQYIALEILDSRQPRILQFSASDRTIRTDYELQNPNTWTDGLRNLARLANLDLDDLARVSSEERSELREDFLKEANEHLERVFADRWSQAKLTIHLGVQGTRLEIFVSSDGGGLYRLEDRSDGLRTYLALIAFLDMKDLEIPPILVFDEAESHLHWDAQADLIRVLYEQKIASQVIYSTHSPGCLPNDLGHGVRAIVPTVPDRSVVKNWVWEDSSGFRPLLIHMGASTAALTPHRFAVATEGVADFIVLPSLLRAATGQDSLSYQIVPGIAQLSPDRLRSIDSESDAIVYLTDGDDGGQQLSKELKRAGISEERIFSLSQGVVLEDLIHGPTLVDAIEKELGRSGQPPSNPLKLPNSGRSKYLKEWYDQSGVEPPSKRAIASHVLELTTRQPELEYRQILAERYRSELKELHQSFLNIFMEYDAERTTW